MLTRIEKVVAYIVKDGRLVVFVHEADDNPVDQSGLQVPAGTCHPREAPANAVLRVAYEETGRSGLRVVRNPGDHGALIGRLFDAHGESA